MPRTLRIYWGRLISAIIIIPGAIAVFSVFIDCFKNFSHSYIPFLLGFIGYTLTYPVFRKPLTGYVIGHELTHVLGIWLSRGEIYSVKIGKSGGMVKTDRINVWTALLPYFFPLYTFLVLGIYYILSILWNISRYFNWVIFILGITWAFHLWMTIHILRQKQPDIRYSGRIFSAVIIFTVNIIVLTFLLIIISPDISISEFFLEFWNKVLGVYLWILRKLM